MTAPAAACRVLVCEDDDRLRSRLERLLGGRPELELVGAVATGEAAIAAARADPPDVLLLDLELPGISGLDVVRALAGRTPAEILILTTFDDLGRVFEAVRAGAAGYLVKRIGPAALAQAILDVRDGGTVIDPALARRFWNLFDAARGRAPADPYGLTEAEREVLTLVGRGLTNPEVGRVVGRTRRAVKAELERAFAKLGVGSRVEAVVKAVQAGLIEL